MADRSLRILEAHCLADAIGVLRSVLSLCHLPHRMPVTTLFPA